MGNFGSKHFNTGLFVTSALNCCVCLSNQFQPSSFSNNFLKSDVLLERLGMNFPTCRYATIPRKRCNSATLWGMGMFPVASTFEGSMRSPLSEKMWPTYLISRIPNSHFFLFSFIDQKLWSYLEPFPKLSRHLPCIRCRGRFRFFFERFAFGQILRFWKPINAFPAILRALFCKFSSVFWEIFHTYFGIWSKFCTIYQNLCWHLYCRNKSSHHNFKRV